MNGAVPMRLTWHIVAAIVPKEGTSSEVLWQAGLLLSQIPMAR